MDLGFPSSDHSEKLENAEPDGARLLPAPSAESGHWAERIEIAKKAREAGSRLREGKSIAAVQYSSSPPTSYESA